MALVAGYVSHLQYSEAEILERLRRFSIVPGDAPGSYEHHVVATRCGALMVKHKRGYPIPPTLVTDDRRNALATLGFILSGDDIRSPDRLLTSCVGRGGDTLTEGEGEFVAVFMESATGTIHLVNDRFAARPCYVLRTDTAVYFASNLAFLLYLARERYRPDVVGWLEVFTYAHTSGVRTTVEGVHRVRPATHLIITPASVNERQYWRLEHRPDPGIDPIKHSAEVFHAFRASAERRARLLGTGVLALSGGLDSRLVAASLPNDTEFGAFTFVDVPGAARTVETDAAAAVCAALGLRHRIETLPSRIARPAEVIALTGGMRPYQHQAIAMAYVAEILREGKRCLLGGGPGDVLAGSYISSPEYLDPARMARCIAAACRRRMARSEDWGLVFRDDVIASMRPAVKDALAASFAAVDGPTAAHRVTAWAMTCRQPAFTFTSVFHAHPDVTEAVSHLGYRYSDLMLQLPAEWLYGRSFYAYMIYTELPQLRHVPYANIRGVLTGAVPSLARPRVSLKSLARQFFEKPGVRHAKRLVRTVLQHRPAPRHWLVLHDATLLAEIQEILHSVPSLGEVLDIPRCDSFLHNVQTRRYTSHAHEELFGGLTSMCISATTLPL